MEISGKLIQFLAVQTGQGKNGPWKKQEFVIETGDTYPKKICIAVWGEKIDMTKFKVGDSITASFDVESREYNGKWYTDVKAWKVVAGQSTPQASPGNQANNADQYFDINSSTDDLPF